MTDATAATTARPFSHLGLALSVVAAAVGGTLLGPTVEGPVLAAAAALPVAALVWAALFFGYVAQRRPSLAAPYFLVLWLAAGGAAIGYGVWRDGLFEDAKAPAAAAGKAAAPRPAAKAAAATPASVGAEAVAKLIDDYYATMKSGAEAYVRELSDTGYLVAVSGQALSAPGGLNAAQDRIRAGREVTARHRVTALARTDALIAAVKALPADTEPRKFLVEDMLAELDAIKDRRADYWETLDEIADEIEAIARLLARTQGAWHVDLDARQVIFENPADDETYQAHSLRQAELDAQLDRLQAGLNRSAGNLKGLAARWDP